jgi:hypothetical protein
VRRARKARPGGTPFAEPETVAPLPPPTGDQTRLAGRRTTASTN